MAGLFEHHDKQRFEVTAISFGPNAPSATRTRLEAAFEHFIDVRQRSDQEIAGLLRANEIDIAVDLKGFTTDCRTGVFAYRPAPIQVNYLGFPGTMGAGYMDYVLGDDIVIPPEHQRYYSEKVVCLPDSYQVNDSKRRIAAHTPRRIDVGLPEPGFVFCCFNNCYKFTPRLFDIWMRLLAKTGGSVLWLLEDNPAAMRNLRREAAERDIDPRRLIFARRVKLDEHLARHRLADLFLDTLPCNAHTTASDALWAGLPVLTQLGDTFAGRVAASLLAAVGLPELITRSREEYEELALKLARQAAELGEVPVGAVAVKDGQVVGQGFNRREVDRDPLAHAELLALAEAARALGAWRLSGVTLYVTLEPCAMCAGALVQSRVSRLVFGAKDPKAGAVGSLYDLARDSRHNHRLEVHGGVMEAESGTLLKEFFRALR